MSNFWIGVVVGLSVWGVLFEALYRLYRWRERRRKKKRFPENWLTAEHEGVEWRQGESHFAYTRSVNGMEALHILGEGRDVSYFFQELCQHENPGKIVAFRLEQRRLPHRTDKWNWWISWESLPDEAKCILLDGRRRLTSRAGVPG